MLLDTCALLWLAEGGRHLTPKARSGIESAPVLYLSAITGFEIGVKVQRRKLDLPMPVRAWLDAVVSHHRLSVVPLGLEECVASTELPPIHQDPCDRFIIGTALAHRLPVVTADAVFREYGVEVVW
ncbi:MAG: type II toxin-antitoxin system VapC family toxin [Deltaproteobacteria bacterium]|nr:type II toxin-antitoxin system VapC family toxin [Deltaproteobacteria bacterium]